MTRRFILTLAMLVLTLGLLGSAAPVGATVYPPPNYGEIEAPPVATGPCLLTGQKMTFDSNGSTEAWIGNAIDKARITGNGFTTVDQNGLGMGVGSAHCSETMSLIAGHASCSPTGICQSDDKSGWAYRVVSATFHGGAHLAPGTQFDVNLRVGPVPKTWDFHAYSNFPSSGYNGDYDLTIPNTVSPLGNDWSTCNIPSTGIVPALVTDTFTWGFTKWDGGKSTLTGDHNGKYWIDLTLEWSPCDPW